MIYPQYSECLFYPTNSTIKIHGTTFASKIVICHEDKMFDIEGAPPGKVTSKLVNVNLNSLVTVGLRITLPQP